MSKGSLDTANVNNAADVYVDPTTNELYVADGYVNRRVIVFDADTGAFKRMWGAYGKPPDDAAPRTADLRRPAAGAVQPGPRHPGVARRQGLRRRPAQQPHAGVHDRRRIRARDLHRAQDEAARHGVLGGVLTGRGPAPLYLADAGNGRVHIYDRASLTEISSIGRIGRYAGQFIFLHALAIDSRGNLYTAEVGTGRRVQKFVNLDAPR